MAGLAAFKARQITVLVNGDVYLQGEPFREIVPDESTWHIDSEAGILEVWSCGPVGVPQKAKGMGM